MDVRFVCVLSVSNLLNKPAVLPRWDVCSDIVAVFVHGHTHSKAVTAGKPTSNAGDVQPDKPTSRRHQMAPVERLSSPGRDAVSGYRSLMVWFDWLVVVKM